MSISKPRMGVERSATVPAVGAAPNIVLVGEHDDGPGVGGLQQASDDLVELSGSRLPGDLQGLGDAHAPCRTHAATGGTLLDKRLPFLFKSLL